MKITLRKQNKNKPFLNLPECIYIYGTIYYNGTSVATKGKVV